VTIVAKQGAIFDAYPRVLVSARSIFGGSGMYFLRSRRGDRVNAARSAPAANSGRGTVPPLESRGKSRGVVLREMGIHFLNEYDVLPAPRYPETQKRENRARTGGSRRRTMEAGCSRGAGETVEEISPRKWMTCSCGACANVGGSWPK